MNLNFNDFGSGIKVVTPDFFIDGFAADNAFSVFNQQM